jgi:hypothetical protein
MPRPFLLAIALGVATLGGTGEARACIKLFLYDSCYVRPNAAAAVLARELGTALPEGVVVLGMRDATFMDRAVQIKLSADTTGTTDLLAALKVDRTQPLAKESRQTTMFRVKWWDVDAQTDVVFFDAFLDAFSVTTVGEVTDPSDPSRRLIYITAFQN